MDYYSGEPEPNDYDDGGSSNNENNLVNFFRNKSTLLLIGVGIFIVILIIIFFMTGGGTSDTYNTKDNDSSLSELYINSGTLSPEFPSDDNRYTVTVDTSDITISFETSSSSATVEACPDDESSTECEEISGSSYTVNINDYTINKYEFNLKVIAENGDITRYRFRFVKSDSYSD